MAVILPFRGCRYDPAAAGSLESLLCPPYDMIGPDLKDSLQRLNPRNAVHLEGGEQPDPVNPEAGYRQAASLFQAWLADGALRQEAEPCFYLMRHSYRFREEDREQVGLFADVLVEDYGGGAVLPHEFTREPAVLDRVALLEAAQTQFSPIMTLYRDAGGELADTLEQVMAGPPAVETPASPQSKHRPAGPVAHCRRRLAAAHYRLFCRPARLSGRRASPLRGGPALPPAAGIGCRFSKPGRRL